MKNALILHGTDGSPQGNWFQWVGHELEKRGYRVWIPQLPHSEKPYIQRYNDFIFSNKSWEFNEESIIIGHSSGAVAILGLLQHLPENVVVSKCILVSAFTNDLGWEALNELFVEPFDFKEIKKHAKNITLIHSDNDPYVPLEQAAYLADQLSAKLIIKTGQGHFNLESNYPYKEFPLLLTLIN